MKENKNKKNIWRCVLAGVCMVSIFVAFTTEGLAINPKPLPPKIVKLDSHMMTFADGSTFSLKADALYWPQYPITPIMGRMAIKLPVDPLMSFPKGQYKCEATFTAGSITQSTQDDGTVITSAGLIGQFSYYAPNDPCFSEGLTGTFILVAKDTGDIYIGNANGAIIASGTGKVLINKNIDIKEDDKKGIGNKDKEFGEKPNKKHNKKYDKKDD